MITNHEIIEFCEKKRIPLVACVTKDQLSTIPRRDGGYILNLQNDTTTSGKMNGGTHWIALFIDGKKSAFFDPFGLAPPMEIRDYCIHLPMVYNDHQIQNEYSSVCGYYCICMLFYMNIYRKKIPDLHKRFRWFINHFEKNKPEKNRAILERLIDPI